jgi:hypothetical protein
MPKTEISDADALARFENGLDLETSTVRDRNATAEIRAAVEMRDPSQGMIDAAVADARRRGLTWIEIAAALGISPQGARQRYLKRA